MKGFTLCAAGVIVMLLTGCASNPQQLPVDVSNCRAVSRAATFDVIALVKSKANRPISHLDMSVTFYQDFRYRTVAGAAQLPQELDPGQQRDVTFAVAQGDRTTRGQALRCYVTRVGYLDGTSDVAPPSEP